MGVIRGTKPCEFPNCIRKNTGDQHYCSGHARQRNRGEELKPIKYKAPDGQRSSKRTYQLKYEYGLTQQQFDDMVSNQLGRCAICRRLPSQIGFHVDHCHNTGKVRGLLCNKCNTGIGYLHDNSELLSAARTYLLRYQ